MKLYFTKGACSLVVRILINELGLECRYESVDLKSKKTDDGKDFNVLNKKGSVPVIELDNGRLLTENAVILQFLADEAKAYELLPPIGDFKRYQVLEWVNYITTEVHKSFGAFFNPSIPEDLKQSIFIPLIKKKLQYVNEELTSHAYLLGEEATLPDFYLFVMLTWTRHFKMDLKEFSHLERFYQALNKRESVKKSLQQEGLI